MPFNQPIGDLIAPTSAAWKAAAPADRLAFFREAGDLAVAEKRAELRRAIGANGRKMKPRKHPRADGANGPVLTPHDDQSRTSRLLASRATATGLTLFWHAGIRKGQKKAWGTILGYHAGGHVPGAPVRDVRLSKRGIGVVRTKMAKWWRTRQALANRAAKARDQAERDALTERYPWIGKFVRKLGKGFRR